MSTWFNGVFTALVVVALIIMGHGLWLHNGDVIALSMLLAILSAVGWLFTFDELR